MFSVVTPPTAEPLSVQEVRVHLREGLDSPADSPMDSPVLFEFYPDDSWIRDKITAARESCEAFLGYPLTNAVYRLTFADFSGRKTLEGWNRGWFNRSAEPSYFRIPAGFVDVESIAYLDANNVSRTLAATSYDFDPITGIVFPDRPWPAVSSRPEAVRLLVRGAYGSDSPALLVPQAIRHAMLLMIAEWYVNREQSVEGRPTEAALGVEYLLRPLRTRLGMA